MLAAARLPQPGEGCSGTACGPRGAATASPVQTPAPVVNDPTFGTRTCGTQRGTGPLCMQPLQPVLAAGGLAGGCWRRAAFKEEEAPSATCAGFVWTPSSAASPLHPKVALPTAHRPPIGRTHTDLSHTSVSAGRMSAHHRPKTRLQSRGEQLQLLHLPEACLASIVSYAADGQPWKDRWVLIGGAL